MNLFEKYREEFRQTVAKMNVAADHNNRTDNFYECGRLAVLKSIIEDMGHTVDGKLIYFSEIILPSIACPMSSLMLLSTARRPHS